MTIVNKHIQCGWRVWDVGANVGVFSLAATHCVGTQGHVLSIEPDPFMSSLLQRTCQEPGNKDIRIDVLCAAVSDEPGISYFDIAEEGRASSSLKSFSGIGSTQSGGMRFSQPVPTFRLDDFLPIFGGPGFIKIDVERAESLVIAGCRRILKTSRPLFYIEVGSECCTFVSDVFREHDYRLYDGDSHEMKEIDSCTYNTLEVVS